MPHRTITVRGISDAVLRALRARSAASRRSLNAELLLVLEQTTAARGGASAAPAVREPAAPLYAPPQSRASLSAGVDRVALAAICRRYHVTRLAVFGSLARSDATIDSDVDLAVDFEPGMTPGLGIETVAEALRPAFGGRRVDLITRRGLSPRLREQVEASAVILHGA